MAGYIGSKTVSLSTTAANVDGNITVTGNVDGRDVSVDGTKLDTIPVISTSSVPSFTAKSDGTTDGYIQLNCSANSHGIKFKSPPHSAGASYTLVFPTTAGTSGQFLKTDGSGNLSWGTDATLDNTKLPLAGGAMTGAITTNSTFDGRNVSSDGTKLDGIETAATADQTDAQIKTAVQNSSDIALAGNPTTTTQSASNNSTRIATTAYTDAAITALVNSAPATLDTLNELAAALGDDPNYAATTTTLIGTKMPKAGGAFTGAVTTNSTFDGVDIAARDAVLTSTTNTAGAALPKAGGTMTGNLNVVSSGQVVIKAEGVNQYFTGFVAKNNYSSTQSQWHLAAAGGNSGWGNANGNFIIRDDTTNSTGIEIERGAGGSFGALYIDSSSNVGIGTAGYGTYHSSNRVIGLGSGTTIRGASSGSDPYITIAVNAFHDASNWKYIHSDFASSYEQYNGTHAFNVAASGSAAGIVSFSQAMKIDNSGRVGIGIAAPADKLDIQGADNGLTIRSVTANRPIMKLINGSSTMLTLSANGTYSAIGDGTSSDRYMSFKAGNIGIGTTAPDSLVHLQKTRGTISGGSGDTGAVLKLHTEAQWESGYNSSPSDFLGSLEFSSGDTSGSGLAGVGVRAAIRASVEDAYNNVALSFETGGSRSQKMRLKNNGTLQVFGGDRVDALDLYVGYNADTGRTASINWRDSSNVTGAIDTRYNGTTVDMYFGSLYNGGYNATDRMVLKGSGYLCVGKTTNNVVLTGFHVGPGNAGVYSTITSANTYHVHDTSNYKFYVNANGGIYNFSSNNVNLSDQREKKNIEALDAQWDAVKAWSVKEFHYNADEDSDAKKVGVIAQDVETNHPELVTDFELTEDTTRKAVKEQQMMWMAIKALQEAQTRIETLETKVAALEA